MAKSCYDRALDLLARRPHFRRELAVKLSERGFAAEEIEDVLARLEARGFLGDEAAARTFVEQRQKGTGKRRLRAELRRRGVDAAVVEQVLEESLPEDDTPAARQVAERWLSVRRRPLEERQRRSLAAHLERKGFSHRAIVAVLQEAESGEHDAGFDSGED